MKNIFSLLLFLFLWSACNNTPPAPAAQVIKPDSTEKQAIKFVSVRKPDLTNEYADAKLETMDYKNGKFTFTYSGTNYKLGMQTREAPQMMCANSDKGQHIHLLIDNEPYLALYNTEHEMLIPDGEHYILAFLSKSYHESIKTGAAHIAKKVKISKGNIVSSKDIKEPMIFYSRPKGTYTGTKETERILLDYYLINFKSEDGKSVRVELNQEPPMLLREWKSHFIKGLPMGENKIKLTLIDKAGKTIKTPLNPVERTFTLKADPLEQAQ